MTPADRELCGGLSALLRCGCLLGHWSVAVTIVAACSMVIGPPARPFMAGFLTLCVLCLGLASLWCTLRLHLDEQLFRDLARGRIATLESLDITLVKLGLIKNAPNSSRSLHDRLRGALSLLRRQAFCTVLQTVFMICLLALMSQP